MISLAFCLIFGAGCATPGAMRDERTAAVTPEPPPPPLTPEQEAEKTEARQVYLTCLRRAAHYVSEKDALSGDAPALIAPMCYGQFTRFEAAAAAGLQGRALRGFYRKGDQLQIELATAAVGQERGLAALSAAQ